MLLTCFFLTITDTRSRTANNFPVIYSQKRFSQASLLISTKFPKQNYNVLFMIFCREVQYSACQHIYKQNYEITAVQEEDSYFQIITSKMAP
jgi:hypothetical protein